MGILSWLIAIPFITGLLVLFVPAANFKLVRWVALAGASLHLLLTAFVTKNFLVLISSDSATNTSLLTKLYMVEKLPWFKSWGIQYLVGIDGISLTMVILTSIII